jgi:enoyl-CoA hydratase
VYETLLVEEQEGIATVTVNRPDKLNALNEKVIAELTVAFEGIRDRSDLGAAILTGAGPKAFIAGADIGVLSQCDPRAARENAVRGQALTTLLESLGKPVLAAINGYALGGGCELALACTLRLASENAKLGQPEVKLGILCGYGGTQRLPRLVGPGRALELLLTGEPVGAEEAYRIGLVNRVVKPEALLPETRAMAKKIVAAGPLSVRKTLLAVQKGQDLPLEAGLKLEADLFAEVFQTEDMREGTAAFLEKRPPRFKGR